MREKLPQSMEEQEEEEKKKQRRGEEADEGTHGWLNPSLVMPSRRQGAHTFPSFSLEKRMGCMQEAGSEVGGLEEVGGGEAVQPNER